MHEETGATKIKVTPISVYKISTYAFSHKLFFDTVLKKLKKCSLFATFF